MRFLFKKGWSKECINDKFFATVFIVDNETKIWHELVENQREPYLDFVPNKVPGIFKTCFITEMLQTEYMERFWKSAVTFKYDTKRTLVSLFFLDYQH